MQVWIDQDCCTGAGLCVDHCPDLFVVLEDGIGYVHVGSAVIEADDHPGVHVPPRLERAAIDAVERCPGECIYVEPDGVTAQTARDHSSRDDRSSPDNRDIVDAELVED